MEKQPGIGILEEFRIELLDCWKRLPNKGFFFMLLAVWLALFQWLGSSTLGYIRTPSLFYWMFDSFGGRTEHPFDSDSSYGFLAPFAVALLFWVKRRELMALELRCWGSSLVLVGLGLVVHLIGYAVQQPRISVVGLFTGLYGLTGLAWGWGWLRASFFPFFLFAFCVPLGSLADPLTFHLRLLVSKLVALICNNILAIDIRQEGNKLMDPTGRYSYEVAAACSGLRSQVAIFGLGLVMAFLSFRTWWRRVLMIGSAFPLAILGNLLRLLAIIIAAELGGQEWGKRIDDGGPFGLISLLPYVPAIAGMLLLERYLREPEPPQPSESAPQEAETA